MPQNYGKNKDGSNRTYWQQLVAKHGGVKKARKHYVGYRQKDGKLKYKGDVTRVQGKGGTYKNQDSGRAHALERGDGPAGFVKVGGVNEQEKWETKGKKGFLKGLLD